METDRKLIVTGASRGIGRAIALAAAKAGYAVTAHYNKNAEAAKTLQDEAAALGGKVELIGFDVNDREDCREKLEKWVEANGAPWGIVNNAGINADTSFAAMTGDQWDSVVHTNLDSFYNVLQPLIMPLARKKRGRIITMASVSGIIGNRGQVNYSASKAGIIGATKALAVELASRSITVNCVAPGVIETEMLLGAPMDQILPTVPMGRVGKPEEVAALVLFLLSDEAAYITRQVIAIDGGLI
jgi:3-oxoacyl-[acyl-carrier protein] reductase